MKYGFDSRVRYSELDENGRLSIAGLIEYFQDCSVFQSESLGDGYKQLGAKGLAWILASWQIVIDRLPELGESVRAMTWPYSFKHSMGERNFALVDAAGEMCAYANSVWVLYDMVNGKPMAVSDDTIALYGPEEKLDMEYAPRKIRILEGAEEGEAFEVSKYQLDTNHHVNNVEYVRMALGALPTDLKIRQLRVEYRFQAKLGDTIHPAVSRSGEIWQVLLNRDDGKPYAIIEVNT